MRSELNNFPFSIYNESLSASGGVTGGSICTLTEIPTVDSLFEKLFCSESNAFQIDGIDYIPIEQELFNNIKNAFKDFGPLALEQLEILQRRLGDNKIFIGQINKSEFQDGTRIGVDCQRLFQNEGVQCVGINLTLEAIEQQMDKYLFIMESKDGDNVEVKAIKFRGLFREDVEIAKLGAYLLFHELFHVDSFSEKGFDPEKYKEHCQNFCGNFPLESILNAIKTLFMVNTIQGGCLCDDALNTINMYDSVSYRCPGEFELLNQLYSKPVLRLYKGIDLNFTEKDVKDACLSIYGSVFNIKGDELIINQSVDDARGKNNEKKLTKMKEFFGGKLSKEEIEAIKSQKANLPKKSNEVLAIKLENQTINISKNNIQNIQNTVETAGYSIQDVS